LKDLKETTAHTILDASQASGRLLQCLAESESLRRLCARLETSDHVTVSGLHGAGRSAALGALAQSLGRLVVWVVPDGDAFETARTELATLLGERLLCLPARDSRPYQWTVPSAERVAERLGTLVHLCNGVTPGTVLLTSIESWFDPTLPPAALVSRSVLLAPGREVTREPLLSALQAYGYLRADVVEEVGQYAVRGGVVDLFSTSLDHPIRMEFWGEELYSLRLFEVGTQRSLRPIDSAYLWPLRESTADATLLEIWISTLAEGSRDHLDLHRDPAALPPGLEWLWNALQVKAASLAAYLPADSVLWIGEADTREEREARFQADLEAAYLRTRAYVPEVPSPDRVLADARPLPDQWQAFRRVEDLSLGRAQVAFGMKPHPSVHGNLPLARREIDRVAAASLWGTSVGQLERLFELLNEPEALDLCRGTLVEGFEYPDAGLLCLTEHELFARPPRPKLSRRFREGVALSSYTALRQGDYVIHADYGVGRYRGLVSLQVADRKVDVLELRYADDDRVYVPIESFNRVRKFSGSGGEPTLSKLGSGAWEKLKARTRRKILEMARELVQLYAERKARPGHAFGPDDTWMAQLEETFPYDETFDQRAAIAAIKQDMQEPSPMDRLVCGDVGFGKTELAIRAALKAVTAGKQVAVLVPTTILAQQHLETFTERLAAFPVRVDILSRFRSAAEQAQVVALLQAGQVDVVVGTHRLLSGDVIFRDLGLLIVDEEHRFGVRHKERIKQLKTTVDCLTLTATPIPRTLQMSLLGARDLSVISTPPQGRLPVHTEVVPFSDQVIRGAIERELERGGQVFMVHNRVQSIGSMYRYLKGLVPQVDIVVAHGQMKESDLERVMLEFSHRRHQVLLSTAIIESGLDIPLSNTILIHRAHTFGLAQLYQLRGRVGRSARQAYAYLLIPPAGGLTQQARRRLSAVEQHSDLGSGFHLAMRDLEIRGAGNLLGAQQHGFIEAVGYDLYTRLVEEAVAEVRGSARPVAPEVQLDTTRQLLLPPDYVPQSFLRVELYQRLSDAADPAAVETLRQEVQDRFGALPEPASDLFDAAICRLVWGRLGVVKVTLKGGGSRWEWAPGASPDRALLEKLARKIAEPHRYTWGKTLIMSLEWGDREPLSRLRKLLQELWDGS
jgi:transcription-repair coupling factor (superfamily II helicase)